jgi:integrase
MASIVKRPNGKWRLDAQRWLDEVSSLILTGAYVEPGAGKVTFAEWWATWSARQTWTHSTRETADLSARLVTFGHVPLRSLRRAHIEEWVKAMTLPAATRKHGLAASTIRTRFNYVYMALRAAVRDRLIVKTPKQRRHHVAMTIPTPVQVAKALDAAPRELRAFVALCAFAGLRLGEAAAIRADDIDTISNVLGVRRQVQGQVRGKQQIVSAKAGSERDVPIPESLTETLTNHLTSVGTYGEEGWLFQSGNALLNRNSAGHHWRKIRETTGLESFTLHDLRHFYASGLIAAGCDVVTAQRALGHASATITLNTYSHLWPTAEDRTRSAAADLMSQCGLGADSPYPMTR